jgi:hypothetical protein
MPYSLKSPLSLSAARRSPDAVRTAKPIPWKLLGMIAATAACLAGAGFGVVGAIVSPMVFDAKGSVLNPIAWLAFLLSISFWAVCLIGPFVSWVFWARRDAQRAWACMALPLAWGVLTLAVLQFLPAK